MSRLPAVEWWGDFARIPSTVYAKEGLVADTQHGEVAGLVLMLVTLSLVTTAPSGLLSCVEYGRFVVGDESPSFRTSDSTVKDRFSRPGSVGVFSGLLGVLPAVGDALYSGREKAELLLTVSVLFEPDMFASSKGKQISSSII